MVADARERDLAAKKAEAQAAVLDSIADEGFSLPSAREEAERAGAFMTFDCAAPMMGAAPPGRAAAAAVVVVMVRAAAHEDAVEADGALRSTAERTLRADFGAPPPQPCAAARRRRARAAPRATARPRRKRRRPRARSKRTTSASPALT